MLVCIKMANKRNTFVKPHALKLEVCNLITPWLFSNPKLTVAQYGVAGLLSQGTADAFEIGLFKEFKRSKLLYYYAH